MISIVITAYNVEQYISECLNSILNQTFTDFEIIIVNDFSTDNSINIINNFSSIDNRIKIINNEKNVGAGMSRKIGIKHCIGDFIMLIDGDDYIVGNDYLHVMYNNIIKTNADIISISYIHDYNKQTNKIKNYQEYISDIEKSDFMYGEKYSFINNKLIKKTLWDKVEYCERRYIEDTPTYYKLIYYANKIVELPFNINHYHYRYNENSLTNNASKEKHAIFALLAWFDIYEFFILEKSEHFKKLFNGFFMKNRIGEMFNNSNVNVEICLTQYPNEYKIICEKIKKHNFIVNNKIKKYIE